MKKKYIVILGILASIIAVIELIILIDALFDKDYALVSLSLMFGLFATYFATEKYFEYRSK